MSDEQLKPLLVPPRVNPSACPECHSGGGTPISVRTVANQPDKRQLEMTCPKCGHRWITENISVV